MGIIYSSAPNTPQPSGNHSLWIYFEVFVASSLSFLPTGSTSPHWISFREAEYKFYDHRTTWDQAQRICSWFASSLASVHSAEEEAFLADTLRKALQESLSNSGRNLRCGTILTVSSPLSDGENRG